MCECKTHCGLLFNHRVDILPNREYLARLHWRPKSMGSSKQKLLLINVRLQRYPTHQISGKR